MGAEGFLQRTAAFKRSPTPPISARSHSCFYIVKYLYYQYILFNIINTCRAAAPPREVTIYISIIYPSFYLSYVSIQRLLMIRSIALYMKMVSPKNSPILPFYRKILSICYRNVTFLWISRIFVVIYFDKACKYDVKFICKFVSFTSFDCSFNQYPTFSV